MRMLFPWAKACAEMAESRNDGPMEEMERGDGAKVHASEADVGKGGYEGFDGRYDGGRPVLMFESEEGERATRAGEVVGI